MSLKDNKLCSILIIIWNFVLSVLKIKFAFIGKSPTKSVLEKGSVILENNFFPKLPVILRALPWDGSFVWTKLNRNRPSDNSALPSKTKNLSVYSKFTLLILTSSSSTKLSTLTDLIEPDRFNLSKSISPSSLILFDKYHLTN